MASEKIGLVVGMRIEARFARKLGWPIAVGGGTPTGAERAAEELIAQGVTGLVSFGLAGGLDPVLFPGDVLVPSTILLDGKRIPCDPRLMARLGGATAHVLLAGHDIIPTAVDKHAWNRETGAHAVDLETGAVAHAAMAHGLPFAALRAICDPANCSLPPAAQIALDQRGAIGFGRVLLSVLRMPGQLRDLRELAADARIARDALLERVTRLAENPAT